MPLTCRVLDLEELKKPQFMFIYFQKNKIDRLKKILYGKVVH